MAYSMSAYDEKFAWILKLNLWPYQIEISKNDEKKLVYYSWFIMKFCLIMSIIYWLWEIRNKIHPYHE